MEQLLNGDFQRSRECAGFTDCSVATLSVTFSGSFLWALSYSTDVTSHSEVLVRRSEDGALRPEGLSIKINLQDFSEDQIDFESKQYTQMLRQQHKVIYC